MVALRLKYTENKHKIKNLFSSEAVFFGFASKQSRRVMIVAGLGVENLFS